MLTQNKELQNSIRNLSKKERSALMRFMTPRLPEQYIPHIPHPAQQAFLCLDNREVFYGGSGGSGKGCVCVDVSGLKGYVHTPTRGFVGIDEIKVGDQVSNPDGTVSRVTGVYPRGLQDIYQVKFTDGRSIAVDGDHKWGCWYSNQRKFAKTAPHKDMGDNETQRWNISYMNRAKVIDTLELKNRCDKVKDMSKSNWPLIPLTLPVKSVLPRGRRRLIPPYTLGVLLGDGSLSNGCNPSWFKPDLEIIDYVKEEIKEWGYDWEVTDRSIKGYYGKGKCGLIGHGNVGQPHEYITALGLNGKVSDTKFIPKWYLNAPIEIRLAILQGLLDTDGSGISDGGGIEYCSTSKELASGVQYLAWSLGYKAKLIIKDTPKYTYNGEQRVGKTAYRLFIQGKNIASLFKLDRKKRNCVEYNGGISWPSLRVVSVKKLKKQYPTICITIDNPNGLFITNDFIVTHNSDSLLMAALQYALHVNTPIATPSGWSTIGNLQLCDYVFDGNGNPAQIIAKTKVFTDGDRYRVKFDDHSSVIADGDHLWNVFTYAQRYSNDSDIEPMQLNTRSMYETLRSKEMLGNFGIRLTAALKTPSAALACDPYMVGFWIHNYGCDSNMGVPSDLQDTGLDIRKNGIGINKYLRAGELQRLSLLRGLMDCGGDINSWGVIYTNKNPQALSIVNELAISLGWNSRIVDNFFASTTGDSNQFVSFNPTKIVFRDPIKKRIQMNDRSRAAIGSSVYNYRYITSIEQLQYQHPVQCITVASNTHTFLAGNSMVPTHNCDVPGYSALILRRTWPDLIMPGAIMDRAQLWLTGTNAKPRDGGRRWIFPSGAKLQFGHLGHDNDKYKYACFTPDTELLTNNGWVFIKDIKVNDDIATVDPRTRELLYKPVNKTYEYKYNGKIIDYYQKNGVSFSVTPNHVMYVSSEKRIATRNDTSLEKLFAEELKSTSCIPQTFNYHGNKPDPMAFITKKNCVGRLFAGSDSHNHKLPSEVWSYDKKYAELLLSFLVDNNGTKYNDKHWIYTTSSKQLADDIMRLAIHSGWRPTIDKLYNDSNFKTDYVIYKIDLTKCIRDALFMAAHKKEIDYKGKVYCVEVKPYHTLVMRHRGRISLTGNSAEFQTICWDELTQWRDEKTYSFLFSRLRRPKITCLNCNQQLRISYDAAGDPKYTHIKSLDNKSKDHSKLINKRGKKNRIQECNRSFPDPKVIEQYPPNEDGLSIFNIPLRCRSAGNPGGIGDEWVERRFINESTRKKDVVFVPATITDNPSLDEVEYRESLSYLTEIDRERLEYGKWGLTESGEVFDRVDFVPIEHCGKIVRRVRSWDMAATLGGGDWTVGALCADYDGKFVIEDIIRVQKAAHDVEKLVQHTAKVDGIDVDIIMEQEPGSSGKTVIDHYRRNVLRGYSFSGERSTGSKLSRAQALASYCKRTHKSAEEAMVRIILAQWNTALLNEFERFPNGAHDDMVDAVSAAFNTLYVAQKVRYRLVL